MTRKGFALFSIWVVLFLTSIGLYRADFIQDPSNEISVAQFLHFKGTVLFREKGQALWSQVLSNRTLTDGTVVATERKSSADILLNGNRLIRIQPSSQIVIQLNQMNASKDYLVTLIKGGLQSEISKASDEGRARAMLGRFVNKFIKSESTEALARKTTGDILVKSQNQEVKLSRQRSEKISIQKAPGAGALQTLKLTPTLEAPIVGEAASTKPLPENLPVLEDDIPDDDFASIPLISELPSIEPTPVAASGPPWQKEQIQLKAPTGRVQFWTTAQLNEKMPNLPFTLLSPNPSTNETEWTPVIEVSQPSKETSGFKKVFMFRRGSARTFLPSSLWQALPVQNDDTGRYRNILLRTGHAKLESGKQGKTAQVDNKGLTIAEGIETSTLDFNPISAQIKVRSLKDFPTESVDVLLKGVIFNLGNPQPWLLQKKELLKSDADVRIKLLMRNDLLRLAPTLERSGEFTLIPSDTSLVESGIYIVRKGEIIGSIEGPNTESLDFQALLKIMDASLVFQGKALDFVGEGKASINKLRVLLRNKTLGEKIYSFQNGEVKEILVSLLNKFPQVIEVLQNSPGDALFKNKVTILAN